MSEYRTVNRWVDDSFHHIKTGRRVSPGTSLTEPNVHNPGSGKKILLDERRKKALELRMMRHDNGAYFSFSEIAEIMQANFPELLQDAPNYGQSTAYTDCMAGIKAIHSDIRDLASYYLIAELEKLDMLDAGNIRATELLYDRLINFNPEADDLESLVSSLNKLSSSMTRISDRKSKFLGLDAPKEIHAKSMQVNMSMDDFLEWKKRTLEEFGDKLPPLGALIEEEVIEAVEGEFTEEE